MNDLSGAIPVKAAWWKRLIVVGFSVGAGVGLVLVIAGFFVWRSSRPASLLPWNKSAIKTSMVNFDVWEFYRDPAPLHGSPVPDVDVSYEFDVQNTTNTDYTLAPPRKTVIAMQKLKSSGALIDCSGLEWRMLKGTENTDEAYFDKPILLPPGQPVRVIFSLSYQFFDGSASNNKTPTDGQLDHFGREQSKDIGSFVLLDQVNHYQIELPIDETKVTPREH